MATEAQLRGLGNWLGVPVKNMEFERASNYMDMLHNANDAYMKDKKANKDLVKTTKTKIAEELLDMDLIKIDEDDEPEREGAKVTDDDEKDYENSVIELVKWQEKKHQEELERQANMSGQEQGESKLELDEQCIADMRKFVKAAVEITLDEVIAKDIPVQGLGGFVQKIATTLYLTKHQIKEGA